MDNRYKQTTLGFKGDDTFECKPERPVPILHIHSEKDRIVPFAKDTSDQSLGFPGVPETIEIWRKLNGVDSSNNVVSTITTFGPRMVTPVYPFYRTFSTTCTKYELSKNDPKKDSTAVVELCKHDSDIAVGHCWPSFGERNIFGFVNPLELTTGHCLNGLGNQYIWNFLKQHSMPSATVHRSANSLSSSSSSNSAIINDDPVASNVPITNNDATIDEL